MPSLPFHRRGLAATLAVVVVATGGLAYAAIPDAGGVIHTCYTKSSGSWRVIDTALGQACKSNEASLDVYSKGGADAQFLDRVEADGLYLALSAKAADSDKLDGQDASAFLGAGAKAADSDKLDGVDSYRYLKGLDGRTGTDHARLGDGGSLQAGHPAEGVYPGISLVVTCDVGGGSTLVATSPQEFTWWWDGTAGSTPPGTPPYAQTFPIADGVGRHTLRTVSTPAWYTTTLDLDWSSGADSPFGSDLCVAGVTLMKSANVSPGP